MQNDNTKQVPIQADNATLKGAYANLMQISHAKEEFILDFFFAHMPAAILTAGVVTSPGHLKRIIAALQDNLKRYEQNFGNVQPAEEPKNSLGFNP